MRSFGQESGYTELPESITTMSILAVVTTIGVNFRERKLTILVGIRKLLVLSYCLRK